MNFLTLIFSLLLILSFGTLTILEKGSGDRRIRSTFLGHINANRKILSNCEKESFENFRRIPESTPNPKDKQESSTDPEEKEKQIDINPECARLNLWPLIQEGREEHPLLYEITAHLFRTFYGAALFENQSGIEYRLLNAFLKKGKEELQKEGPFALEKLSLDNSVLQLLYYKMMKGTKDHSLSQQIGYPSLLDSIRIEKAPTKICLSHANQDQMAIFFGFKAADKLYQQIHQKKPPPLTRELIENICLASHATIPNPTIYEWFAFGRKSSCHFSKKTFVEEDYNENDHSSRISLRKNVYLPHS